MSFEGHNLFSGTPPASLPEPGSDLLVSSTLRFRMEAQVMASLVGPTSSELIFLALRC